MESLAVLGYISGAFGLISIVASSIVIVKSTTARTTIDQQKELIEVLVAGKAEQKDQITELQNQHIESTRQMANLQGQLDVLKTIPLVNIDTTLKEIAKFNKTLSESNNKILDRLDNSATVLADNTKKAKLATEIVKSDLEKSNEKGGNNGR